MTLWKVLEPFSFLLRTIGLILQVREVKRTKSIYGLSFDYVTLSAVELLMAMLFSISYMVWSTVHQQYARRFPLHPEFSLDYLCVLSDTICLASVVCLMAQSLKYRNTRHKFQSVSAMTLVLLSIFLSVLLFVLHSVNFKNSSQIGAHGLFLIDLVDSYWLIGNCAGIVKWAPQFTTNFVGAHCCQITREASWIEALSASLLIIGRLTRETNFYDIPVNEQGFLTGLARLVLALLNVYQIKLYQGRLKTLPTKSTSRLSRYDA